MKIFRPLLLFFFLLWRWSKRAGSIDTPRTTKDETAPSQSEDTRVSERNAVRLLVLLSLFVALIAFLVSWLISDRFWLAFFVAVGAAFVYIGVGPLLNVVYDLLRRWAFGYVPLQSDKSRIRWATFWPIAVIPYVGFLLVTGIVRLLERFFKSH
jgi:hypothetical protein